MINIELNIDLMAEYRALDSDLEYRAENRPGRWNIELSSIVEYRTEQVLTFQKSWRPFS